MDKRDQELAKVEAVQEVVQELLDEDTYIDNVQTVVDQLKERLEMDVKVEYVRKQMKDMRLSFMKVKHINVGANTDRSLVLRQRWALQFLSMDWRHKNVINVDETWLGMTDYRRMHWRPRDREWSVKAKQLQPRISMITAVDKVGNVWVCLTMSNSNKSMMGVFMEYFCRKLDQKNQHWRNSTVIQWDGR